MDTVFEIIKMIVLTIASLLMLGLATERGTQITKEMIRTFAAFFPALKLEGRSAFILAAAIAFAVTYTFNIDMTKYLALLDGYDPALITLVNSLLLTFVSNQVHNKYMKA